MAAVHAGEVTLETLLDQRVAEHPDRSYLRHAGAGEGRDWSYAAVRRQARRYAAALMGCSPRPRVALITTNSVPGALIDLAERDDTAAAMLDRLIRNLSREQDRTAFADWTAPSPATDQEPSSSG